MALTLVTLVGCGVVIFNSQSHGQRIATSRGQELVRVRGLVQSTDALGAGMQVPHVRMSSMSWSGQAAGLSDGGANIRCQHVLDVDNADSTFAHQVSEG